MDSFPLLSSKSVSQYPTVTSSSRSVQVIRFLDGSDQRFPRIGRTLRRWQVDLALLSNTEIAAIEQFFTAQKGMFSVFTFTDPASNSPIPNCRFATSEMVTEYLGWENSSASFWILETNG